MNLIDSIISQRKNNGIIEYLAHKDDQWNWIPYNLVNNFELLDQYEKGKFSLSNLFKKNEGNNSFNEYIINFNEYKEKDFLINLNSNINKENENIIKILKILKENLNILIEILINNNEIKIITLEELKKKYSNYYLKFIKENLIKD